MVLEAREVCNQGVGRAVLLLKDQRENPAFLLLASGSFRLSLGYGSINTISASVFTWPSSPCVFVLQISLSSYKDTSR